MCFILLSYGYAKLGISKHLGGCLGVSLQYQDTSSENPINRWNFKFLSAKTYDYFELNLELVSNNSELFYYGFQDTRIKFERAKKPKEEFSNLVRKNLWILPVQLSFNLRWIGIFPLNRCRLWAFCRRIFQDRTVNFDGTYSKLAKKANFSIHFSEKKYRKNVIFSNVFHKY